MDSDELINKVFQLIRSGKAGILEEEVDLSFLKSLAVEKDFPYGQRTAVKLFNNVHLYNSHLQIECPIKTIDMVSLLYYCEGCRTRDGKLDLRNKKPVVGFGYIQYLLLNQYVFAKLFQDDDFDFKSKT